ncbi:MAG: transglycosylase domain-containing protein [Saprospiraceae bacterium]|nr:transglycosylase domain-containing protein [Saprospiraceae bacterium]MDW8229537.1 transglycosylase domain-containing protein [Saprospiraceae bacterium]
MLKLFSSLRENHRVQSLLAHIRLARQGVADVIHPLLSPVWSIWAFLTAPVRAVWRHFEVRHPFPARVLSGVSALFRWGIYFLLFLILCVWAGLFGRLPSTTELRSIETANATEIYSADSVLLGKFYVENRTTIPLEKISPYVVTALLATEDRRFFEHSGIDLTSWVRVAFGLITRDDKGGGSTLSQQLAKNLYPRKRYAIPGISLLINKIRENFISVRLERIYTKAELLNLYLNTVPFGGDRYGISVAARHFYNRKAQDLTPDQAATLIGMLKATTYYDPVRNPENATRRRNVVLQQMVKNSTFNVSVRSNQPGMDQVRAMIERGRISQKEYNQLVLRPLGARRYHVDSHNEGLATYFREYLRTDVLPRLLKGRTHSDGTPFNLYTDGLRIYTTIHSRAQRYAEEAVRQHMSQLQNLFERHWKGYKGEEKPWGDDRWIEEQMRRSERWLTLREAGWSEADIRADFEKPVRMTIFSWHGDASEIDTVMTPLDSVRYYFCLLNCGFMAMEHANGYVRAWVGGIHYKYFKYDHVRSTRQVGSTFKPIVYAAALQDSLSPCTYLPNRQVKIVDWEPRNANGFYGGWYSLTAGLTHSVNVIAAQLIERVGIEHTIQLARKMGVTARLPREFGISLGAADISLYEMIQVYGTMANKGIRPEPVVVLRIVTRTGEVVYDHAQEIAQHPPTQVHALTPDHAATMTRMMQSVVNSGTGSRLRHGYGLHEGDFAGKTGTTQNQADGWFICYNPRLVTGAWVGASSPAVRFRSLALGQGASMALPIVGIFWHKMANDREFIRWYQERFPEPPPHVLAKFGCPGFINISPDTLQMLLMDSTLREDLRQNGYQNLREVAEQYFEQAGAQPEQPPTEETPKRPNILHRLFGQREDQEQ